MIGGNNISNSSLNCISAAQFDMITTFSDKSVGNLSNLLNPKDWRMVDSIERCGKTIELRGRPLFSKQHLLAGSSTSQEIRILHSVPKSSFKQMNEENGSGRAPYEGCFYTDGCNFHLLDRSYWNMISGSTYERGSMYLNVTSNRIRVRSNNDLVVEGSVRSYVVDPLNRSSKSSVRTNNKNNNQTQNTTTNQTHTTQNHNAHNNTDDTTTHNANTQTHTTDNNDNPLTTHTNNQNDANTDKTHNSTQNHNTITKLENHDVNGNTVVGKKSV